MGVERPDLIETLITEEIRRIVADAIGTGSCLSASPVASEVLRIYPTCGLTERQLIDRIIMAAGSAGIAVEIGAKIEAARVLTEANPMAEFVASYSATTPKRRTAMSDNPTIVIRNEIVSWQRRRQRTRLFVPDITPPC